METVDKLLSLATAFFFLLLPFTFAGEWVSAAKPGSRRLARMVCALAALSALVLCLVRVLEVVRSVPHGEAPIYGLRLCLDLSWFLIMGLIFAEASRIFFWYRGDSTLPPDFWGHNRRLPLSVAFAGWCALGMIALTMLSEAFASIAVMGSTEFPTVLQARPLHTAGYILAGLLIFVLALRIIRNGSGTRQSLRGGLRSPVWNLIAPKIILLLGLGFGLLFSFSDLLVDSAETTQAPVRESLGGLVRQIVAGLVAALLAWKSRSTLLAALGAGTRHVDWAAFWPGRDGDPEGVAARLLSMEIPYDELSFRQNKDIEPYLNSLSGVELERIGASREGSPLWGIRFGNGEKAVSVIAGCHADEPAGPVVAQWLPVMLARHFPELLEQYRFHVIAQMNPDGAVRNAPWLAWSLNLLEYARGVVRELPGDDIEFGFSATDSTRPECQAAQQFLEKGAPYHAHFSLHGADYAEGAWFLASPERMADYTSWMNALGTFCDDTGMPLRDIDRKGEKGFSRIREGFSTTPNSEAMRRYFMEQGDQGTADRFMPSSMEFVSALGGSPACIVSEVPLFRLKPPCDAPRSTDQPIPLQFKQELQAILQLPEAQQTEALDTILCDYEIAAVPIDLQVRLISAMIVLALKHIP